MTHNLGSVYSPPRAMRRRKRHAQASCVACHLIILPPIPGRCPGCGAKLRSEPVKLAA